MAGLGRRLGMKLLAGLLLALLYCGQAAAQTLLVLGDSISAGYGLEPGQGWVDLCQMRLQREFPHWSVVNASVSGETTAGGRVRLPALLAQHRPQLVLIELGANDGLRGQPLALAQANLQAMIEAAQQSGARVMLLGMRLPPNYGLRFTEAFSRLYATLAQQQQTALVPFLLEGVGGVSQYMQADGLHPNAAGQSLLLENVWKPLQPLL